MLNYVGVFIIVVKEIKNYIEERLRVLRLLQFA